MSETGYQAKSQFTLGSPADADSLVKATFARHCVQVYTKEQWKRSTLSKYFDLTSNLSLLTTLKQLTAQTYTYKPLN